MKQVTWRGTANPEISYRLVSVSCQKFLGKRAENMKVMKRYIYRERYIHTCICLYAISYFYDLKYFYKG